MAEFQRPSYLQELGVHEKIERGFNPDVRAASEGLVTIHTLRSSAKGRTKVSVVTWFGLPAKS